MIEQGLPLAVLGAGLGTAAVFDVAERRIPNGLIGAIAIAGVAAREWADGVGGLLDALLAGTLTLLLLLIPWAAGAIGGGDVKLAAAAAAWLTPSLVGPFLIYAAVAGGPVALAAAAAKRWRLRRRPPAAVTPGAAQPEAGAAATAPLAVAIALGALAALRWGAP